METAKYAARLFKDAHELQQEAIKKYPEMVRGDFIVVTTELSPALRVQDKAITVLRSRLKETPLPVIGSAIAELLREKKGSNPSLNYVIDRMQADMNERQNTLGKENALRKEVDQRSR